NFSAFSNAGTLCLLETSKEIQKQGINLKIKLIESENFRYFITNVADEIYTVDNVTQIKVFIDKLLPQFKNDYSTAEIVELFKDCNDVTRKYISQKFTEEPIHKVENQIEQTKNKRFKDKANSYQFGVDLHKNTKKELSELKSILGVGNLQYKMRADNVAKEVLQCSIDYFNESQAQKKSNNYLEDAMKLANLASGIAVSKITKDRIKDNINTLEDMKGQELNQAIELLKSVKSAYETNKIKINNEVSIQELRLPYGQSINWTKVNQLIENSIDWAKVTTLIKEVIPPQNVEKIKHSENQSKISEYKSLVDFLLSKLNYSQKNQVKYLCYWKSITTSSHSRTVNTPRTSGASPYQQPQKSWAEENPGCLIAIVIGIIICLISIFSS
ncbi:MAG: hypothetical protein LBE13_12750, partial [Bacteroidales bacterium]|nr:hypothetical protein [Bacteroidales bacterium]